MKPIVIDASMAAAWTLDDKKTEQGDKILDEIRNGHPVTISLFWHGYRNILVFNQRRGGVVKGRVYSLLQEVRRLGIGGLNLDDASVISLAFQYDLSAYDAAYLALAVQTGAALATNDRKLAHAAITAGLELRTALDADLF